MNESLRFLEHLYNLCYDLVSSVSIIITFLTTKHHIGFTLFTVEFGFNVRPIDLLSSSMITVLLLAWILKSLVPVA